MTIADELTSIVSERDQLKRENESFKYRIAKQAGAQEENRAENRQLITLVEKQAARIATLEKHFYDFHGSADRIQKQKDELNPPVIITPAPEAPSTILGKLTRLGLKTEVAA